MLFDFHDHLRRAGIKVSLTEWLNLIDGLSKSVGTLDIDAFYSFARLCLVKNESLYDRFDQVFRDYWACLLYTSPSPRDKRQSRMPSSA